MRDNHRVSDFEGGLTCARCLRPITEDSDIACEIDATTLEEIRYDDAPVIPVLIIICKRCASDDDPDPGPTATTAAVDAARRLTPDTRTPERETE